MAKKTEDRGSVEERLYALEEAMTKVFEWINNGSPSDGPVVLQATVRLFSKPRNPVFSSPQVRTCRPSSNTSP